MMDTRLTKILEIKYPIILAPMFLVSNTKMVIAALQSGITAAFPALNYRTDGELRAAISEIKSVTDKPFGVNLIVNKSNIQYKKQLTTCLEMEVDFFITSLGNPKEVIELSKQKGIKVFCDVVDLKYAKKVEELGADAIIAVNNQAGGHAGDLAPEVLIPLLKENCSIPIISAGGVATKEQLKGVLELGADGASVGSIFIASQEADVTPEYKNAIVEYGAKDIIMTTRLSGTPCTVINTPYMKKIGTHPTWLERLLHSNNTIKKYIKMLIAYKGFESLRKAAKTATYKTIWCAGPSIEHVNSIQPIAKIVQNLTQAKIESRP